MLGKQTHRIFTLKSKAIAIAIIVLAVVVVLAKVAGDVIEDAAIEGISPSFPPVTSIFSYIVQGALSITATSGYFGIFFLMLLESSSLPIPSEVILPFSGYLASQGNLNLWLIIAITTMAGTAGSLVDYYLGLALGLEGIKRLRYLPIREKQLQSAVKWFDTYGQLAVFGSRLVPVFRTLISFPAGIVRMPKSRFLSLTVLGCLLWNTILTYAGFYAGVHWEEILSIIRPLSIAAVIAIPAVLILYYALTKMRQRARA
jgi:membrane protein DedA with SNARE-associated domain